MTYRYSNKIAKLKIKKIKCDKKKANSVKYTLISSSDKVKYYSMMMMMMTWHLTSRSN